ncbi:MAG: hypothetical protein AAGB03_03075 [Pseudomonadota bacterium]
MGRPRTVIVASAQTCRNPKTMDDYSPQDPARMMAGALQLAAKSLPGASILGELGGLACVEPFSWGYDDLAATVGQLAGANPKAEHFWLPAGGNSPQDHLHNLVEAIGEGRLKSAALIGGEALHALTQAFKTGVMPDWPPQPDGHDPLRGQPPFTSELETRHGLTVPYQTFALYENGLRAHHKRTFSEQIVHAAKLLSRNSRVAAANPFAWFRTAWTVDQIARATPDNRMIAYPYPKRMNAFAEVDQAAALIVMSAEEAEARGLSDRAVHILGGAGSTDAWFVSERRDYHSSPGMTLAINEALKAAACTGQDVDVFDLYSCFPCAVEIAHEALELDIDGVRPLTTTGGLAYFGGPGNSYTVHSLASAYDQIRREEAETALVTGLGMSMSKLAATVLSNAPDRIEAASGRAQSGLDIPTTGFPGLAETVEAPAKARIETYTVEYAKDGRPDKAILILRLEDGRRTLANAADLASLEPELMASEPIGRQGTVTSEGGDEGQSGVNRFAFG